MDSLKVYLHGISLGTIYRLRDGRIHFEFDESYLQHPDRATLSQSYREITGGLRPYERPSRAGHVPNFFSNLLPEGALRTYLANLAGVSENREFELLAWLGNDLPGAVTVINAEEETRNAPRRWSATQKNATDSLRFSLAGVQLKFSAIEKASGGLTVPAHGVGGDWIVKLPSTHYEEIPANEFAMMTMARMTGIDTPEFKLIPIEEIEGMPSDIARLKEPNALILKRFDRVGGRRVHIEDFAQALGLSPHEKYNHHLNYADVARLIAEQCSEVDVLDFAQRLMFNILIGNGDMHLKNWSLLYQDGRTPELAPAYDYLCTTLYLPDDNTALRLGSSRNWSEITLDDFALLARQAGANESDFVDAAVECVREFQKNWKEAAPSLSVSDELKRCIKRQCSISPAIKAALTRSTSV